MPGAFEVRNFPVRINDVADKYPELPLAVCQGYSKAKQEALVALYTLGWANISLPWIAQDIEDTRKVMGDNPWPYGIKANEKALETLFQYSFERHCQTNLTEPA
ncbi:MAG: hypothetical protein PVI10_11745 [Methyloceanibacter sp.]|jgi:4,5-dihydroxyphthalate decarboxylase